MRRYVMDDETDKNDEHNKTEQNGADGGQQTVDQSNAKRRKQIRTEEEELDMTYRTSSLLIQAERQSGDATRNGRIYLNEIEIATQA